MSDDDLENDDLEVGDEDEGDEGLEAAADDGAEDAGDDDSSPAPAAKGKSKAAVAVDEMPSMEAKQKERDALARPWKSSSLAAARFRKSRPTWSQIHPRSRTTNTAAALSEWLIEKKPAVAAGFFVPAGFVLPLPASSRVNPLPQVHHRP